MGLRDKYRKKDSAPKFRPMDLNEMNVNAVYVQCVKKNENGEEIWDKQNLKHNRANIRYLLGQLEAVHQNVHRSRLDSGIFKLYTGYNWTSNPTQMIHLIAMGEACGDILMNKGKEFVSFLFLTPTLSPRDPAFIDWYEGGDGLRIRAEAARESGALSECLALYEKGAEQGDSTEQFVCAQMYHKGTGTEIDSAKALYWYEKAAEQGLADAQYFCGKMYYSGEGTTVDKAMALYWFEKVGEQEKDVLSLDLPMIQFLCGKMYDTGEGTPVDKIKAFYWYEKSAKQGNAKAQVECGIMLYNGEGTKQQAGTALKWLTEAATQDKDEESQRTAKKLLDKIMLQVKDVMLKNN